MWTALISSILGMIGGAIPDIIKEVRDARAHVRERAFLTLNHQFAVEREKIGAESRMREAESNLVAAEVAAMREHLTAIITEQAKPTGIPWIDGFNAFLRPATAALMMVLFAWTAYIFASAVMARYGAGAIDGQAAAQMIWGSLIGEAILAVLGFLFGYRSTSKRSAV